MPLNYYISPQIFIPSDGPAAEDAELVNLTAENSKFQQDPDLLEVNTYNIACCYLQTLFLALELFPSKI